MLICEDCYESTRFEREISGKFAARVDSEDLFEKDLELIDAYYESYRCLECNSDLVTWYDGGRYPEPFVESWISRQGDDEMLRDRKYRAKRLEKAGWNVILSLENRSDEVEYMLYAWMGDDGEEVPDDFTVSIAHISEEVDRT